MRLLIINTILKTQSTLAMLRKSIPKKFNGQTLSALVLPAKIFPLLANAKGLKENEATSFLKQLESSVNADPMFLSLKTSKGYSPVTKAKTLKSYCKRLPTLGFMTSNGNCLILAGFYPKTESGFTLSDVLVTKPNLKYFLSEKALKGVMRSIKKNLKGKL
jgi:hypothetical protein